MAVDKAEYHTVRKRVKLCSFFFGGGEEGENVRLECVLVYIECTNGIICPFSGPFESKELFFFFLEEEGRVQEERGCSKMKQLSSLLHCSAA